MGNRILDILKKIPFDLSFILLVVYFVITKNFENLLIFVFVILLHEFAHAKVAKHFGYQMDNFCLTAYGASLNYKEKVFNEKDELYIALAGPLANIFTAIFVSSFWWFFPSSYNFTSSLVWQSLIFAFFNMLPCYPLDGGRVFLSLFSQTYSRDKVVKILSIFNIIFAIIMFVLFVISCATDFNPTFALATVFLIFGLFENKKEAKYKLVSSYSKDTKNFSKVKIIYIKPSTKLLYLLKKIDRSKFTIFAINNKEQIFFINEKKVLKLALEYSPLFTIEEILYQIRHK